VNLTDALIVTGLGIGVVFFGLVLTNLMVYSFYLFPRLKQWWEAKKTKKETLIENTTAQPVITTPDVTPEIIAAITAVLEVEFRLRDALMEGRYSYR